jgi:hypothetical protein
MEPRQDESQKEPEPRQDARKRRFQIVKLEERIAPARGGKGTNNSCGFWGCGGGGYTRGSHYCGP